MAFVLTGLVSLGQSSYQSDADEAFSNLDKSGITTGIL